MKHAYSRLFVLAACLSVVVTAQAGVDFGSKDSGFNVISGTLEVATGSTLTEGTLKSSGGTLTGTTVSCNRVTVETVNGSTIKKVVTDGTITIGSSIALGNNDRLIVKGGTVAEGLAVSGTSGGPSVLQGSGSFSSDISVADLGQLNMRWDGPLNVNISLNAGEDSTSTLLLERDLVLLPGKVISGDGDSAGTHLVKANGNRLFLGGNSATLSGPQEWQNVELNLTGPISLASNAELAFNDDTVHAAPRINGYGHSWNFGSSSVLTKDCSSLLIENVVFTGMTGSTIVNETGSISFVNTRFEDASTSFTFDGSINSRGIMFGSDAGIGGASKVVLNKDLSHGYTWTLVGPFTLDGSGHIVDCQSSGCRFAFGPATALTLANITLANVANASIDTSATNDGETDYPSARIIRLNDVTWMDVDSGSIRINGSMEASSGRGAAQVALPLSANAANILGTIGWSNGANIELLDDVILSGTWTFTDNTVIDGNGKKLGFSGGVLSVASGKTLYLRNVVLDQGGSSAIPSTSGTVSLSDVTIILPNANVSWGTQVSVDGPCTVVTGSHSLTVPEGSAINDRVTLLYDTLTSPDAGNHIVGFNEGSGRIACMNVGAPVTLTISADYDVNDDIILQAADGGMPGRSIVFTGDAAYWFNGHGRTVHCPYSNSTLDNDVVISVTGSVEPLIETLVKTKNVTFDGFKPTHLSVDEGKSILFGPNTVVNLNQDWTGDDALATTLTFGTDVGATNEITYLDLRGHTIDMANGSAGIALQGTSGCKLYIMNGRITNLSGTKITATSNSRIIYENVDISLSADYTSHDANTTFQGRCKVSGLPGSTFINPSLQQLLIASNSVLTFTDGVVYSHHNDTVVNNFVFTDKSSCLELIGAVFRRSDPATSEVVLPLSGGTIIIDHKVYFQPGLEGIMLGDTDTPSNTVLIIRPGANIVVTSGGDASAGTLELAV